MSAKKTPDIFIKTKLKYLERLKKKTSCHKINIGLDTDIMYKR